MAHCANVIRPLFCLLKEILNLITFPVLLTFLIPPFLYFYEVTDFLCFDIQFVIWDFLDTYSFDTYSFRFQNFLGTFFYKDI